MSQLNSLIDSLQSLKAEALQKIQHSADSKSLYDVKVLYLGKQGKMTDLMKGMAALSGPEKPQFGKVMNEVKVEIEEALDSKNNDLRQIEIQQKLEESKLDVTLPGRGSDLGSKHPYWLVIEEISQIMGRLGYSVRLGPHIEQDYYNFEALNIPADHPAREMQDTFFISPSTVLRTHTSPIQIHTLENEKPPLRVIGLGAVFRCDSDISHLPHFHQIEGMCVDKKISMADLKGTISFFVKAFFGDQLKTRFRPSYFPFTEPSAEVDCTCPICVGKGCSLCKNSGWIEIGGCGLINPKVLINAGVQYPDWQGFAFGFGVERMAIIKYGIEDIRLFPENDIRFLRQFA